MSAEVTYLIIALLMAIAGFSKSVSDTIQHHWAVSIFSKYDVFGFWGKESWVRKYKNGDPQQGERFWLSSTVFVCLTDAWHLGNMIRKWAIFGAWGLCLDTFTPLFSWVVWLIVVLAGVIDNITFHLFYTFIFRKKIPTVGE